jgi:UDP-N-acetylmuramoyl-tripeptide--D-alanyl-D-alanine ligase
LDFATLAKEVDGKLFDERYGADMFEGVSIDSRNAMPNQLFIAIRGENDDGHRYIDNALRNGAVGLLVVQDYLAQNANIANVPIVMVKDTHQAMLKLASQYRRKLNAKFIAITGSNGKTTTKEITYAMIALKQTRTYRSPGNLNNLFGLPLALFSIPSDTLYGIFELGISTPGEMTQLAGIVQPELALITNIGPTHLATLGTVENVAEAKLELIDSMDKNRPAILNADNLTLMKAALKRNRQFITYGIETDADFMARRIGISDDGYPLLNIDGEIIKLRLFGEHQAYNILAGYAVCKVLGIDIRPIELNEIDYRSTPYRGEIENFNGLTIIADCYNANPVSLKSGLESFHRYINSNAMQNKKGIAVIGDMLELGEKSPLFHSEIGSLIAGLNFPITIVVGKLSEEIYTSAIASGLSANTIIHFVEVEQAGAFLSRIINKGDVVYFKASRGIGLEKIITLLKGTAFRQN